MSKLEVADIFRSFAPAWCKANAGHIGLEQLKVISAIDRCRRAQMGGHVLRCDKCETVQIAYNSCRNRHCPKCQASAVKRWLEARQADVLPVEYFHVVFTLPAPIADIAYQNKAIVYNILFKAAAETLLTIGADSKHLGAKLGFTAVLHTWGSALTHHPHVHCIIPGGGLSADKTKWVRCRADFFLPVLSRLFRRLFLEKLTQAYNSGELQFYSRHAALVEPSKFKEYIAPVRKIDWVVYAKRPFAGPRSVLAYLSRYTHRVAIANSRLLAADEKKVTFTWKDYRKAYSERPGTLTLDTPEFIRRFLLHVLPDGFHRIRHYGMLANTTRAASVALARELLCVPEPAPSTEQNGKEVVPVFVCRTCGEPMKVIEVFECFYEARAPPIEKQSYR